MTVTLYMCMIHTVNSSQLIKVLTRSGWVHSRTKGSHHQFTKDGKTVTVPHPKKDLGVGLVKASLKQAGIE